MDEHLLIIPIYHYSSLLALPANIAQVRVTFHITQSQDTDIIIRYQEVKKYIEQLVKMYTARDMNVCVFERYTLALLLLTVLQCGAWPQQPTHADQLGSITEAVHC